MMVILSLSVRELVQACSDSCKSTAQKDRETGKKGPATKLKLRKYTLSRSFSHELSLPVEILGHQSPFKYFFPCRPILLRIHNYLNDGDSVQNRISLWCNTLGHMAV